MSLTIARSVYAKMLAAAQTAAPLEACGLLAGQDDQVTQCYVLTNVDASAEHFSMKPEEQFAAIKQMRATGLRMLGIWHSHPASPARMSEEDLRLAYTPDAVYVILSLLDPTQPQIRAFVVPDNIAQEVPLELVAALPAAAPYLQTMRPGRAGPPDPPIPDTTERTHS